MIIFTNNTQQLKASNLTSKSPTKLLYHEVGQIFTKIESGAGHNRAQKWNRNTRHRGRGGCHDELPFEEGQSHSVSTTKNGLVYDPKLNGRNVLCPYFFVSVFMCFSSHHFPTLCAAEGKIPSLTQRFPLGDPRCDHGCFQRA